MNNNPVAIMGMGPAGLFLVRQLRHITENIYAIGRSDDVGMFSRYIKKGKRFYAQTEDAVFASLMEIQRQEKTKPIVYLCSDQYLTMFVNSSRDWTEACELSGASLETLRLINNKAKINQYCVESGIRIPSTLDMVSFCTLENKEFPIVVKWKEKELGRSGNPIGKIFFCKNESQFNQLLVELDDSCVTRDMLLIQPLIIGDNDYQYSVGGFYKEGLPIASTTVKQVKQYPQGVSAQVYTVDDAIAKGVEKIAFELAKKFNFTGFLETEFKIDKQTGTEYLLDVNPRPWGWVSILGTVYPDFYEVLRGENPKLTKQDAIWTSPIRKFLSSKNPKNVKTDVKATSYKKAYDIADFKDRIPSVMIYLMAIKKMIKR